MWPTRVKTALWHYIPVVLAGLALLGYVRYVRSPDTSTSTGIVQQAPPPKVIERVIEKIRHVRTPGPERIVYLDRPMLAAKLEMPELAVAPDNAVILGVAEIPAHRGPTTVVSELTPTGEGRLTFRPEPPPFFDLKKEFGVRGGIGTGGLAVGELYLRPLAINPKDRGQLNVELRAFIRRTDLAGSDFGAAVLLDYQF